MNLTRKNIPPRKTVLALVILAALGLTVHPADAQTVLTAADSHVGAAGSPRSGGSGVGKYFGNTGGNGYLAQFGNSLVVNGPTFVGGPGGPYTATDPSVDYQGGSGGDGLLLYITTTTINSGSFMGGIGGLATGTGKSLSGGSGGSGLSVGASAVNIFGGTFQGGDSGSAEGTGTLLSAFAGPGLILDSSSTVNIYGGSFTGGNGAVVPGGSNGTSGDGLFDAGSTLKVYGGSFTGGNGGFGLDILTGKTTLYGSGFLVNGVTVSSGPVTGMGTITGLLQNNRAPTTFTYQVLSGTLNIISVPVPIATSQNVTTVQETPVAVTLSGSDTNTPPLPLTYAVSALPQYGTLTGTAPNLTYTPNAGYTGPDSFTFTVSNGTYTSAPATISLAVIPIALASLTFSSPVSNGTIVTATVALNGPAVTTVVGLSSSNSSIVHLHRAVVIPAGSQSATFAINTYSSHVTKTVTIQATLGTVVQAQDLTIMGQ